MNKAPKSVEAKILKLAELLNSMDYSGDRLDSLTLLKDSLSFCENCGSEFRYWGRDFQGGGCQTVKGKRPPENMYGKIKGICCCMKDE